jgi:hypothetical protein
VIAAIEDVATAGVDACTLNNVLNVTQLLVLAAILRIVAPMARSRSTNDR